MRAGTPYWGICFGAQLLAGALGAEVVRGPRPRSACCRCTLTPAAAADPVFAALPATLPALQWHSDTFALPAGAVHLASSPAYPNQAFRWGRAYGLQFHLEAPAALVEEWLAIPEYAAALRATLGDGAAVPFIDAIREQRGARWSSWPRSCSRAGSSTRRAAAQSSRVRVARTSARLLASARLSRPGATVRSAATPA